MVVGSEPPVVAIGWKRHGPGTPAALEPRTVETPRIAPQSSAWRWHEVGLRCFIVVGDNGTDHCHRTLLQPASSAS
jgi:hypothetical protein